MNWHKLSPAILTLLVFLLAQGVGTALIVVTGLLTLPDFSISPDNSLMPLILMAVDILAVLICYFLLHNIRLVTWGDIASISWRPGLLGIAGGLMGALSVSVLTEGMELPEMIQQMTQAMSRSIMGVLVLTIVGPITEELLFREAIEGEMLRRGASPWTAIIVSALAFGAVHFNLAQCLYALPLGIMLGIIYYKTGNIVLTSLLHILNNSIVAVLLHTMDKDMADVSYAEWFGSALKAYAFMAFSGLLCLLLMKAFWTCYSNRQIETQETPS